MQPNRINRIIDGYYYSAHWYCHHKPETLDPIETTHCRMAFTILYITNLLFLCTHISTRDYFIFVFPLLFNPFTVNFCVRLNDVRYQKKNRKKIIKYFDKKPKRHKAFIIVLSQVFFYSLFVMNLVLLYRRIHA